MAKVGEGDERWIVKEREDGTNVNGWHWKETNLTGWSQSRLKELLGPVVAFEDGTGYAKVTEVEKIEGDVTVQSRKQKKFPLYELEIKLKWEGQLWDAQVKPNHSRTHTSAHRRLRSLVSRVARARLSACALPPDRLSSIRLRSRVLRARS